MKIKGADLIAFWREWPGGDAVYCEEVPFTQDDDGVLYESTNGWDQGTKVDPAATYSVTYGFLGWQGAGPKPDDFEEDLVKVLRKWLKARTTTTLIIDVPNAEVEAAKALLKERKWKVR